MKKRTLQIGDITIGNNYPPLVVPEIGINHGGDLKIAFQMVDAAYRSGAKIIKHQTHIPEDEMSKSAKKVIPGNAKLSIYEIIAKCALSETDEILLKEYVETKGMIFLSTPFSRAAADRLEKMNVVAYKIGSGELNNYPLLDHIASFGKPMIVSTGMNGMNDIFKAIEILDKHSIEFALLHTTNLYPTEPSQVRLGAMEQLMKAFPEIPVGLSDHTLNNNACIAAIALGAAIVERHFTDNKQRIGPDIICSMDEFELKDLLNASCEIHLMRGGVKAALPEEQITKNFAFATVVAIKDIKEGDHFSKENIWVKRPGTGKIVAEEFFSLIGKRANCNIRKDTHLEYEMIRVD